MQDPLLRGIERTEVAVPAPAGRPPVAGLVGKVVRLCSGSGLVRRAEAIGRLLTAVGPLALVVIGSGAFARHLSRASWHQVGVTLEEAARVTSGQLLELARYVEQADPHLLEQVCALLS